MLDAYSQQLLYAQDAHNLNTARHRYLAVRLNTYRYYRTDANTVLGLLRALHNQSVCLEIRVYSVRAYLIGQRSINRSTEEYMRDSKMYGRVSQRIMSIVVYQCAVQVYFVLLGLY